MSNDQPINVEGLETLLKHILDVHFTGNTPTQFIFEPMPNGPDSLDIKTQREVTK